MKIAIWLFLAQVGFAALPPLAQSIREVQAILADKRLYNSLGSGEMIREIVRKENGYLVVTENYVLEVDIQYTHKGIGPIHFDLEFQDLMPRN